MPDLHDRIDILFTDEPEHPTGPAAHLRTGRRALRRRRIMSGTGALALVAVFSATVSADPVAAGSNVAANTARNTTLRIRFPPI